MSAGPVDDRVITSNRDVVVVNEGNRRDWDLFVNESPVVIAWHSYDFAAILKQHHSAQFYPLAVYDGPKICGILPLYRIRTLRGEALLSVPHFVAGGIAALSPEVQQLLLAKAVEISRDLGIPKITFKQYKWRVEGELVTDSNYYNRELTLSPDIHGVWESISPDNREKIEQGRKLDGVLDYPSSDLSSFYRILLHDQRNAGVPCVSRAWIETLYKTGMYEIALLRQNGVPIAGTMAKKFRHTVSFPFSCLRDQSERGLLSAYALYWGLIEKFAGQGIRIFHSGRIPNTDQALSYRLGWGGTKYSYYYQYYGLGTGKTEFSNKRGGKRRKIEALWRKLPIPVARVLGPIVVKQYP